MVKVEGSRARPGIASRCWIAVVILVIVCLAVSLATRYTLGCPEVRKVSTLKSASPDAHRQRLSSDALEWTDPTSSYSLFQPPRPSVFVDSAVVPSTNLSFEHWLYNRPPPVS
jgi:hypothetical protein